VPDVSNAKCTIRAAGALTSIGHLDQAGVAHLDNPSRIVPIMVCDPSALQAVASAGGDLG